MSGHRQAAVALYSLAARDQDLILAELGADDQVVLREYLAELADLGFDKNAVTGTAPAANDGAAVDARARLMAASPAAVLTVLAHEPATLVAQVLSLGQWPWAPQLLELLAPARRKLVREAMDMTAAAAPARDQFLVDAISRALPAPVSAQAVAPSTSRWFPWTR
jgi:hypothetical protein